MSLPLGVVWITHHRSSHVNIVSPGPIYEAIGVDGRTIAEWQDLYGYDSLGVGSGGQILAPGFPVFSKVAWFYVDPVELSFVETSDLIDECGRAISMTTDAIALNELTQLRELAIEAQTLGDTVTFGHP